MSYGGKVQVDSIGSDVRFTFPLELLMPLMIKEPSSPRVVFERKSSYINCVGVIAKCVIRFNETFNERDTVVLGTAVAGGSRSGRGILLRTLVFVFLATFLWLQLHVISLTGRDDSGQSSSNETLFSLVPQELHR